MERMIEAMLVTEATILKPLDVLINPFGELFRIVRYYCRNSYVINDFDKPEEEDSNASVIVTKETLIAKLWRKMDYRALIGFVFNYKE